MGLIDIIKPLSTVLSSAINIKKKILGNTSEWDASKLSSTPNLTT